MTTQQERARAIGEEVHRLYPKGDIAQGIFKQAYNAYRQSGEEPAQAERLAVESTRGRFPGFAPTRNLT